jgi:hypothetical protein
MLNCSVFRLLLLVCIWTYVLVKICLLNKDDAIGMKGTFLHFSIEETNVILIATNARGC